MLQNLIEQRIIELKRGLAEGLIENQIAIKELEMLLIQLK